ncbi:phosphate regulon sensor histidine kinase PhoR [Solemya velesiana gill symbiont]|uniref:Phosphate regulon sensor protein PhoR n=1 Tax=Solemya velesiana gill symbiont TaxID=1918948 RepID=A0A1T2KWZ8_9GAMM|nr:phosphate regulon sensor histidine kinase PhoR [Solemya velesiana gill symbiont]
MSKAWQQELAGIALAGVFLGLAGAGIGHYTALIIAALLLYLAWHFVQLTRLTLWLRSPKRHARPYSVGLWRAIIELVEELRVRGKKRKRKLGRMLSGFRESTSALPDATVVLDDRGGVEWWNSVAGRVLGLERKRDKGLGISELISDPVFQTYLACGDYSRPLQMPAPVDDSVNLEVRIVPYGKGKRLLQARDITRLSQLETVRRDFVANVSHEMRTPLTVVHGYLESMNDSGDQALSPWSYVLGQMQQQTVRMQRIVEDLLLLSRLESHNNIEEQEVVDMSALMSVLKEGAEGLSAQNHEVAVTVEPGLNLYGSVTELESAFSNLVFNAVRYTPTGGRVTLNWECGDEGEPCFSVTDNGIGIAPEHIPRLTERFYRVDVGRSRQSGGTGLGLAIVKHVLTRHQGRLQVKSEPGKGSTFSCSFPDSRACWESLENEKKPLTSRSL